MNGDNKIEGLNVGINGDYIDKVWGYADNIVFIIKNIQSNTLCSGFYQKPLMGVLAIFSTGTYAIIGTTCVESETCYEKYHEKKIMFGNIV